MLRPPFKCSAIYLLIYFLSVISFAEAQDTTQQFYDIGSPNTVEYFVDPSAGSDSSVGSSSKPWRTVQHAWNQIPQSQTLSSGFVISLRNGNYGYDELPNYWENRIGTQSAPIILRSAPGSSEVKFVRDINMANVSYFYLLNINITPQGGGDTFHCEKCDHILLRGNVLNGGSKTNGAHETVKINQSQYIYIEGNDIFFADDNNIDFVGVQYGHVVSNKIHGALDWCMYVKGGSAYLRIESNQFYDCGTGGFTAGQGSGFQFMTSPWIHYEAYDIKFLNNIIHDTEGAAFGVNGGYNILLAHNTAYRVGSRSHLVEVVFGERTCDGESDGRSNAECSARNAEGGWGPSRVQTTPDPIGNKNVSILNNIVFNPSPVVAPTHFAIYGARSASAGTNISSQQITDANLLIKGNIIWNGAASTQLGVEDSSQGCQNSNPSCNLTQLLRDNSINQSLPQLRNPDSNQFQPTVNGNVMSYNAAVIEDFMGGDRVQTPLAPLGNLSNTRIRDFSSTLQSPSTLVGAFASPDSPSDAVLPSFGVYDSQPPAGGGGVGPPQLSRLSVKQKRVGKQLQLTVTVNGIGTIDSITTTVLRATRFVSSFQLTQTSSGVFRGRASVKLKAGVRLSVTVTASASGQTATISEQVNTK